MTRLLKKLGTVLLIVSSISALKIAAFSDLHLNPAYDIIDPNTPGCELDAANIMPYTYAPFGRKFCDSPPALLELTLKHLHEEVG
jgi:hypothetical protein